MNEFEKIYAEIQKLTAVVTERMDKAERRIEEHDRLLRCTASRSKKNSESIAALEQKVKELSETAAVWHSRDRREIGIDRGKAYDEFHRLGYSNRDALKHLESAGILRRAGEHLTKPVRIGDRVIRAIVIMEDEN